jgi:2-keto-4-pentenoate hydratase/2-oxohepta-3-ene-1,7-dioic acid hydratase in catechol pathway
VLDGDDLVRDLSSMTPDIDGRFLSDPARVEVARQALASGNLPVLTGGATRLGAPIAKPGKVVGIGLNYHDHAAEAGVVPPAEPVVFLKASSSVVGPYDNIELPPGSAHTDWEVELGVVLGHPLRRTASETAALSAVAGYVVANDVTERRLAADGPTWAKGKCSDTFCPLGPWLVTPDEIDDPQDLDLRLSVNGAPRQSGHTGQMVFGVGALLTYLSGLMTLEPGDLVLTGTPAGVAMGHPEPKPFLRAGDVVEPEVQHLGRQRSRVVLG